MNDQTAKKDAGKLEISLVPTEIIWAIARVRTWATHNKYSDPENYKTVEIKRYNDALLRHTLKYLENPESIDEESGLNHLDHIATNIAFILQLRKEECEGKKLGLCDVCIEKGCENNGWQVQEL